MLLPVKFWAETYLNERHSKKERSDKMKFISKSMVIIVSTLAIMAPAIFFLNFAYADFQVAYTGAVEMKPAVAYNSNTGKFLVAYLIETNDLLYGDHYELRCQLHNTDGSKSGDVLYPLGSHTHEALGRPDIAYNPNLDQFFVAIPARQDGLSGEPVMGRFLSGSGANLIGPDWLFNDGVSTYYTENGSSALNVVCNTILNEFMVTVQRRVPDIYAPPWDHQNQIQAQRISYSSGLIGSVVVLLNAGINGIYSHAIAYAPVAGTSPNGGRYLWTPSRYFTGAELLDSTGNIITNVPLDLGKPDGNSFLGDIAFGEVEGKKRFLLVYFDQDNCKPFHYPCTPNTPDQWTGVWGAYVDPSVTSYGPSGNNNPFPISYIWSHISSGLPDSMPRVSYNPSKKAFGVVWREVPVDNPNNDESRSHIRGNTVNYFVEDGTISSDQIPLPDSNVVISDVTGTCPPSPTPCYSDQDPTYPDVSASYGSSAVVVWHQKFPPNPDDLDVMGDLFELPNPPNSSCEGDFNGDGDVDGSDLAIFAADFGRTNCGIPTTCKGDFNNDGDVDGSDLATFAADFGRTDCQ